MSNAARSLKSWCDDIESIRTNPMAIGCRPLLRGIVIMFAFILTGILLLSSVTLATPSWAQSDEGSAFLDWSSLTITGVALTPLTQSQFQWSEAYTGYGTNTVSNTYSAPSWSDHVETASLSSFQSSTSSASAAQLLSVAMVGEVPGLSLAETQRGASFLAMNAGDVTVNVRYGLTATHGAYEVARLLLGVEGSQANVQNIERFRDRPGSGLQTETGTLSLTRSFNAGDQVSLTGSTYVIATSVPIPDMLWPAIAGLIGVSLVAEWRRRRSSVG